MATLQIMLAPFCNMVHHCEKASALIYKILLSALRFVHHVKGVPCLDPKDDYLMKLVLRGAANAAFAAPARPSTRHIVSLPLLALLGHRIGSTSWSDLSKQTVWSACTLAFFSAARMGELLASEVNSHDPTADLTWADVQFPSEDSILVRLKCTKSSDIQGEFLDIFPFDNFGCCPVASLKRLLHLQQEAGVYNPSKPVFRFSDGKTSHSLSLTRSYHPFCLTYASQARIRYLATPSDPAPAFRPHWLCFLILLTVTTSKAGGDGTVIASTVTLDFDMIRRKLSLARSLLRSCRLMGKPCLPSVDPSI